MKNRHYIDDPNLPDLPLFKQGATREEQVQDLVEFVGKFDGRHFDAEKDQVRLTAQMKGVYDTLKETKGWMTVAEIESETGYPQPSISAQLRNMRKEKFGALDVKGRYRAETRIFEYKLGNVNERS
jgi:predicted Rossmann fold nucleotide-binding protein DprA/Smf involved in DNA uptake